MLADVGNLVQRINGARIDGAGAGYDRDWEVSILPILTDSIVEGGWFIRSDRSCFTLRRISLPMHISSIAFW
jgi:hypothetical protein